MTGLAMAMALFATPCRCHSTPCEPIPAVIYSATDGGMTCVPIGTHGQDRVLFQYWKIADASGHPAFEGMPGECIVVACKAHDSCRVARIGPTRDDLGMARAVERFVAGVPRPTPHAPPTLDDRLVGVGLAASGYYTRKAAERALVRRGWHAGAALRSGLISPDPEVRTRCEWAIFRIETGLGDEP